MEASSSRSDRQISVMHKVSDVQGTIASGTNMVHSGFENVESDKWFGWLRNANFISISIGFIYLWFGALKIFPTISPAEELATNTVVALSLGILSPQMAIISLTIMELAIGIGLIFMSGRKFWLRLALFHMVCTFTPLIIFPELCFGEAPLQLTLVGQYILKNVVILAVLIKLLFWPSSQ